MNTETLPQLSFSLIHSDKSQREQFVSDILRAVDAGEVSALQTHLFLKSIEDVVKRVYSSDWYKNQVTEEAQKYGKSFDYGNAKIEVKETGVKYDYSVCNDPVLKSLREIQVSTDKQVKEREEFLKRVPSVGMEVLIEDEVVTLFPPSKSGTTSVAVTLK